MCGTNSHIITSVELTKAYSNDSPELQSLIEKTSKHFNIKEVSADKAYSSRKNFQIISDQGALPFIQFKVNNNPKQRGCRIWTQCYYYFTNYKQEFLQEYHKRSNIETCFSMIKQKFSKDLMTKTYVSQCNEILLKILCHNICCLIQEYHENNIKRHLSTETQKLTIRPF